MYLSWNETPWRVVSNLPASQIARFNTVGSGLAKPTNLQPKEWYKRAYWSAAAPGVIPVGVGGGARNVVVRDIIRAAFDPNPIRCCGILVNFPKATREGWREGVHFSGKFLIMATAVANEAQPFLMPVCQESGQDNLNPVLNTVYGENQEPMTFLNTTHPEATWVTSASAVCSHSWDLSLSLDASHDNNKFWLGVALVPGWLNDAQVSQPLFIFGNMAVRLATAGGHHFADGQGSV